MKPFVLLLFMIVLSLKLRSQNLPSVQKASFRAPADVKIDGLPNEWKNKFQAYNSATDIFYTMSNDDDRLFLVFQAKDKYIINKIVNGGLLLSIQKNYSKNEEGSSKIQFPFFEKGKRVSFLQNVKIDATNEHFKEHILDSAMKANNQKLTKNVKWIYTNNLFGTDSLLSIYNNQGIQAANAFDINKVYTCEIAIDLKRLGLSVVNTPKFNYHITINGGMNKATLGFSIKMNDGLNANGTPMDNKQLDNLSESMNRQIEMRSATTDFWGEYILIK